MRRIPSWLGLALATWLSVPLAARAGYEPLEPGRAVERRLAPGDVHRFTTPGAGDVWRLSVRQLGVDLAIEVFDPAGTSLGVVDGPIDRRGVETVLVEPSVAGGYRIEVRATTPRAAAGRYLLRIESLAGMSRARLAAERAMTAAARAAGGDGAARRRALASYDLAADGWRASGDRHGEARAVHAKALLLKDLRDAGTGGDPGELFRRAANLWRDLDESGLEALALAELGIVELGRGTAEQARALLEDALALNLETDQPFEAAGNRMDLGYVAQRQGALGEARASYEQALELYRQLGDATWEAVLLGNLGGVFWQLGEATPALDRYRQSLALHRAAGDRKQEARILNNLAALHRSLGEPEHALELYEQAGSIYAQLGDLRGGARVLNNTGYAYAELGEVERARGYFLRALEARQKLGDRRGAATTLSNLGRLHDRRGKLLEALGYYLRSLELYRALGQRHGVAGMAGLAGRTFARLGRERPAREHFALAQQLLAGLDNAPVEARMLVRRAQGLLALGDDALAAADASRASDLYRGLDDPAAKTEALAVLARAAYAGGRLGVALETLEEALAQLEKQRAGLGNPAFRETFLGSRSKLWELRVDVLMEMHRRQPGGGFARAALEAAEHGRARGLLDLLNEAGAVLHRGFAPAMVERRRRLARRLGLLAGRPGHGGTSRAEQSMAIEETHAELDLVEAEMRRLHPGFAALDRRRPLDTAAMLELLEPRELLVYYALGEERSFLWALGSETIAVFELPPRARLEATARAAHDELATARLLDRQPAEPAATALGEIVLAPLGDRLARTERLLVVADGALHWIPFAALPMPVGGSGRLLERHEVIHLPSISVLAALAGTRPPRSPRRSDRSLAVVADPVFDPCDPRARVRVGSCPESPDADAGTGRYPRLPGSRREAEAVAELAAGGEVLLALDFEAARELVTGGRLASYRYLHFATHGVIDTVNPRLSGLVLSGADPGGRTRDGVLRLDDIYNLELSADLVVLSGCRTATGREIQGEGLVGLVRGFFYAGARQVVASLWQVDDAATVELMHHFYRALLGEGLTPAAALRSAQLTLARQHRTRDPYYWAGFVVQGAEGTK